MKKTVTIVLILICTLTLLAGCGSKEETLDGKWVIDEIINPDGSKTTAKRLRQAECLNHMSLTVTNVIIYAKLH